MPTASPRGVAGPARAAPTAPRYAAALGTPCGRAGGGSRPRTERIPHLEPLAVQKAKRSKREERREIGALSRGLFLLSEARTAVPERCSAPGQLPTSLRPEAAPSSLPSEGGGPGTAEGSAASPCEALPEEGRPRRGRRVRRCPPPPPQCRSSAAVEGRSVKPGRRESPRHKKATDGPWCSFNTFYYSSVRITLQTYHEKG